MKSLRLILVTCSLILATFFAGCSTARYTLPPITGRLVEYTRTDPLGGTTISAKGVEVTADKIMAEDVTWDTKYPQFTFRVHVVGYEQFRAPDPKPQTPDPITSSAKP